MSAEGLMEDDLTRAIRSLQAMGRIPQTGKIDQATLALMSQPRCGVEDSRMGVIPGQGRSGRRQGHADRRRVPGRRRYRRYVEAPTKWPKKTLTYRVQNWARGWEEVEVRRTMMDAFKLWSSATRLQFREVASGEADIMIQFASRYHRDGYPFDGKGMILAHAFFPGEGKGGDTHFDDDEKWTLNSTDGVDLFMVAAHEFGHALGLAHSADPGALMYPWYQGFSGKFVLPRDDTEGIQKLYGGPHDDIEFPVQPPVTDVPYVGGDDEDTPDPCTTPFDAITIIRDVVFLFIGKTFWRLDENNKAGAPVNIHKFWRGLPPEVTKVDAVFENPIDKRIIFFSGKRYWLFNANTLLTGFKTEGEPLTDFGIPEDVTRIDTVFTWGFNKRTYLVSRDMYWKLNENNTYRELDYPRDMSIWRGVPESLDAALKYRDGKTYFFKGNRFWKFYDLKMRVEKSYPRRIASDWLQCSSESDSPVVIGSNLAQHSVDSSAAASHRHHGLSVGLSLLLAVLSASRSLLHTQ
ncbi:matrix metalloproteinase-17-like isoform X2 [Babylonia areolata]